MMNKPGALLKTMDGKDLKSGPRYLAVVLGGFVVDLSVAWSVHALVGLPLVAAAAVGFIVAMTISYFVHEFWTFERTESAVSVGRFAKFVMAAGATLATRLVLVWLTGMIPGLPGGALAQLLLAFGGSLMVGFLVNRGIVFTDGGNSKVPKKEP